MFWSATNETDVILMRHINGFLASLSLLLAPTFSHADASTFTLNEFGDGYILLNRDTGTVSQCRTLGDDIVCELAADDRLVLEERIDELEREIEDLKATLAQTAPQASASPETVTADEVADGAAEDENTAAPPAPDLDTFLQAVKAYLPNAENFDAFGQGAKEALTHTLDFITEVLDDLGLKDKA